MISDMSLDELHKAARDLNLRYVAFGRDHYDVPDVLWPQACQVAELVDPRDIVRSLRKSGLRVPGGKPKKSWRRVDALPERFAQSEVGEWLDQVRAAFDEVAIEVLVRPTELVVLHLIRTPDRPDLGSVDDHPPAGHVVHTVADNRYSLELVLPWDEQY